MTSARTRASRGPLGTLARLYGIQTRYRTADGRWKHASDDTVLMALRAYGAPVDEPRDLADALRERERELWGRVLDLTLVAWDGVLEDLRLRLPASELAGPYQGVAELEDGTERAWHPARVTVGRRAEVDGTEYVELVLRIGLRLPAGYHRLHARVAGRTGSSLLMAAPRTAPGLPDRRWGLFLPMHAVRTDRDWGLGDLSGLAELAGWTGSMGGRVLGTLPAFAAFLDGPLFEPSPYSPVSRLFWNEAIIDVEAIPDLERSPEARALIASPGFRKALGEVRASKLVDHRASMALKRQVLEILARTAFEEPSRRRAIRAFSAEHPRVGDYAAFRAAYERHGKPWGDWPDRERAGRLATQAQEPARRYHLYAQFVAERQMKAAVDSAKRAGADLYFDFPLGVHPDGYDVWRERDAFALDASTGAPPDAFFSGGQDWGFPPPHPEGIRNHGYAYLIESIRHVVRHAGLVRLDHVMWLHRLFWIPRGAAAAEGVYVRYPSEDLYAIMTLEATRAGTVLVGEDLGTVPSYVRRSMAGHGLLQSHVLELEVAPDSSRAMRRPPRRSVASLNTHDLPPFAAFWRGDDIRIRQRQGWLDERGAASEQSQRDRIRERVVASLRSAGLLPRRGRPTEREVLTAVLLFIARSPAQVCLVNVEDLWLDPRPQNVPGTTGRFPNWRRRARFSLERARAMRSVTDLVEMVNRARETAEPPLEAVRHDAGAESWLENLT